MMGLRVHSFMQASVLVLVAVGTLGIGSSQEFLDAGEDDDEDVDFDKFDEEANCSTYMDGYEEFRIGLRRAFSGYAERNEGKLWYLRGVFLNPSFLRQIDTEVVLCVEVVVAALFAHALVLLRNAIPFATRRDIVEPTLLLAQRHEQGAITWHKAMMAQSKPVARRSKLWPLERARQLIKEMEVMLFHGHHWAVTPPGLFAVLARSLGTHEIVMPPSPTFAVWDERPHPGSSKYVVVTPEQGYQSLREVVDVLESLRVDYFPMGGTLIGLLRYGALEGELTEGKVDVVDRDIDFMVRVYNVGQWLSISSNITSRMLRKGWTSCALHPHALAPFWQGQYVVLKCMKTSPYYHVADFEAFMVHDRRLVVGTASCDRQEAVAEKNRKLAALLKESHCTVEKAKNSLRECVLCAGPSTWLAGIDLHVIYPLARCKAYDTSVPCPRHGHLYLDKMNPKKSCMALPVLTGDRNPRDPRNVRMEHDGITRADVEVLRKRAAELDEEGFSSFVTALDSWRCKKVWPPEP
eukprot:TRINITY_DN39910_c0_g2_i1.p1 TRINITY_DN39910_c0_g2~~TRINITY_DN39910_c0_g2_i1.p1  ORF type:complete len:521 (+),score=65.80 TRINITY_DN39910_c0_g2_i1:186-1748(+)